MRHAEIKTGSEWSRNASPRQIQEAISWSRRDFLRSASAGAAAAALAAFSPLKAMAVRKGQKGSGGYIWRRHPG